MDSVPVHVPLSMAVARLHARCRSKISGQGRLTITRPLAELSKTAPLLNRLALPGASGKAVKVARHLL